MSEQVFKSQPAPKAQIEVPSSLYRNKELLKVAMAAHKGVRGARQADPAHAPPKEMQTPAPVSAPKPEAPKVEAPKPATTSGVQITVPSGQKQAPPRPARKTIVAYDGRWY